MPCSREASLFFWQADFRFFCRTIKYQGLADVLHWSGIQALGNVREHGFPQGSVVTCHFHFNQLMCCQGMVCFFQNGFSQPGVADLDNRTEFVGQ